MKTYRVSWTEPEVFNAEVEVDDDATKDDIIYEAQRARDHGEVWVDPSDGEMEDISIGPRRRRRGGRRR